MPKPNSTTEFLSLSKIPHKSSKLIKRKKARLLRPFLFLFVVLNPLLQLDQIQCRTRFEPFDLLRIVCMIR